MKSHVVQISTELPVNFTDLFSACVISKYSAAISEIFILTYFNILDSRAEYPDITVEYLNVYLHVQNSQLIKITRYKKKIVNCETREKVHFARAIRQSHE